MRARPISSKSAWVCCNIRRITNEKLPITTTDQGWVGALQPYVKSTLLFSCPQEELHGTDNLTDYWFNRRLAGVESKQFVNPAATLMCGDGEPSDDPNSSLAALPPLWISKTDSPARRHADAANYLFADGHVKSLQPNAITTTKPNAKSQTPTFLAR